VPDLVLPDGGRLAYAVRGAGPPLLLVAGLGGVASFWDKVVPAFEQRFTVVLHDHRGTGRSSIERIDYSIDQMAGDVLALMDHLGIDRAHYVGHSTGGAIGQYLALDHGSRLDRLVLSATWPAPDAYFEALFTARADLLRIAGAMHYLRSTALLLNPPWWIRDHPELVAVDEAQAQARLPDPEVLQRRISAILRHDRSAELHRIVASTLVIGARDDMVTPAYFSEALGRAIGTSTTVILPDGGHTFPVSRAARFARVVDGFLAGD
jgi:aminoacrylate hydrolase